MPLRTIVRDRIRGQIVAGVIAPGARLVERNLAAELGVSRVPVREALRDLVAEGYAIDRATNGIAVRSYPATEVDELFEIRAALEAVLIRRALNGLPDGGAAALQECLDEAGSALDAGDQPAAVAANARFHEVLADVAAGPLLRGMLIGIQDRMRWLLRQHTNPTEILAEHRAMFDAIRQGDPATADRIFRQHLATSRAALTGPSMSDQPTATGSTATRSTATRSAAVRARPTG